MTSELYLAFSEDASVTSFRCGETEYLSNRKNNLFEFQLRDFVGNPMRLGRNDFANASVRKKNDGFELVFSNCQRVPGTSVSIQIRLGKENSFWSISVFPGHPDLKLEWVIFPKICFRKFPETQFLLPLAEGTLISDLRFRQEKTWFPASESGYALNGVNGFYPGPASMQFTAALNSGVPGLYFACPDSKHTPKTVDLLPEGDDSFSPLLQQFTGGENTPGFETQISFFDSSSWENAAELYREWMTENDPLLPEKQSVTMPDWMKDSPVLLIYPVKGHGKDLGGLEENEYFPYANALPVIGRYQSAWKSRIMALLMHWEGTAPWAPPYVWPPSGGEKLLKDFVNRMHDSGNLVGLYASGIGWTQKSMIDPSYDRREDFEEKHLAGEICRGPRGEAYSSVCNGPGFQRIGYDLCPGRKFTAETVMHEIRSVHSVGVDYLQYFDQNQGCTSPICYAKDHGHPALPGTWQTQAMRSLLEQAQSAAGETVLGCENAAAEPYMHVCRLNDLRSHLAWGIGGVPVPLYSYLFHEYASGFTGNGVCLNFWIDLEHTPIFTQWNLAWNFIAGNLLAVVLKDHGKIFWNWATLWDETEPPQEAVIRLIGNLNAWRKGRAAEYLIAGRMEKTPEISCASLLLHRKNAPPVRMPVIQASAWSSGKKRAVMLVNYTEKAEPCRVMPGHSCSWKILSSAGDAVFSGDCVTLTIPPLDGVLLEEKEK